MFSSQPQASTPWAQKTTPFGTPAAQQQAQGAQGAGFGAQGTAFGASSAAFGTPGAAFSTPSAAQTQAQTFGTPGAPANTQNAPWLYTQQSPAPSTLGSSLQGASDAPHVTASPAEQGPVGYIPGYLSRLRGSERPAAATSRGDASPPAREADTSLSLSVRDAPARVAPSTSPSTRFSSSFFNGDRVSRSPSVARYREGSIFGHGGLRGSRREDADRSMSLRPGATPEASPAMPNEPFAFGTSLEDDDAPPQETLAEAVFPHGAQSVPIAGQAAASAGAASAAQSAVAAASSHTEIPASQRSVVVYGYPRFMRDNVIGMFASDALVSINDLEIGTIPAGVPAEVLPAAARLVYAEPLHAMHALRRSGELMAGCLVGVRWEDDSMHRLSLGKGLDAPLLAQVGTSAPSAVPATPARSVGAASTHASAPTPVHQTPASTPLVGRPIEVVNASGSILARPTKNTSASATPLRAVATVGESLWKSVGGTPAQPAVTTTSASGAAVVGSTAGTNAGAPSSAASTSVLGRLADGLFGW
ncbi:hypothetical protein MCUN1_001448 [Malassezia cuniculi]|uniref:RRM Nup35-type domain-containing protein n=1 Tax=Malassezia cuniculi TaxID=948313 RepID=A0AAF0EU32_9BASI|nr:hypothetical protein MCUN1_001448 [Malassezia cuniculi]